MELFIIVGVICIIFGLISIVRGKMPFFAASREVKKPQLHARIQGGTVLVIGAVILGFVVFQYTPYVVIIAGIAASLISVGLEVYLKVY